jgi:hypothetical protein
MSLTRAAQIFVNVLVIPGRLMFVLPFAIGAAAEGTLNRDFWREASAYVGAGIWSPW